MSKKYLGGDMNTRYLYECKLNNNNKNLKYIYYKAELFPRDNKERNLIVFDKNKITKSEFFQYSKEKRFYCKNLKRALLTSYRYPKEQRESFVSFKESANYAFRDNPKHSSKRNIYVRIESNKRLKVLNTAEELFNNSGEDNSCHNYYTWYNLEDKGWIRDEYLKTELNDINQNEVFTLAIKYSKFVKDFFTNCKQWTEIAFKNIINVKEKYESIFSIAIKEKLLNEKAIYLEKKIIPDDADVYIIGDIHSSIKSLIQILKKFSFEHNIFENNDTFKLKKKNYIIFLGDMVDRGPFSIEILIIISKLKLLNWDQVFIINGNHEDFNTYKYYGFLDEINKEIIKKSDKQIIHYLLKFLPSALFIKFKSDNKWYQLCHGGIEPDIDPNDENFLSTDNTTSKRVYKKTEYEEQYQNGLKWTDFDDNVKSIGYTFGRGYVYGPAETKKYLQRNNIHSIISGHQDNVNLALLTDEGKGVSNFDKCERYPYNLKCPSNYSEEIKLNPEFGGDFLALITSTCTESKGLPYDSYLKLSYKNEKF
jgi:hypothetical protein